MLNSNCDLKISDFIFASCLSIDPYERREHVVNRWYRAPEFILACDTYDYKVDVWSVGCILMEVMLRKPLFPGDDYIHQINLIFQLLGTPADEDVGWMTNQRALQYVLALPKQPAMSLDTIFAKRPVKPNPQALDLITRMLVFNPQKRISVVDALAHPYFASTSQDNVR